MEKLPEERVTSDAGNHWRLPQFCTDMLQSASLETFNSVIFILKGVFRCILYIHITIRPSRRQVNWTTHQFSK